VALEAGSGLGWERWVGAQGLFIDTRANDGSLASAAPAQYPQILAGQLAAEAILRHLDARQTH
jgi:hypothetical protein